MNLLELAVKIVADDQATKKINSMSEGAIARATAMGHAIYDVTKAVVGRTYDALSGIVSGAVKGYASYEQLVGGVDKLYGNASKKIQEYAQNAYKTAGMSANQYMETATSFSASLLKSLNGDTDKAAELTDIAMRSMSDNVNTFGTNMEDVQHAYQGLAKENYTMLDNLKLGFAGTKAGAQELVAAAAQATDAQAALGLTVDANSLSFDNLVKAIDVIQYTQGIWGTTSREAATTIEGSLASVKASWDNLLVAFGSGNEDLINRSVSGLAEGIFGTWNEEVQKREGGLINNLIPVVYNVGNAIVSEIPSIAQSIGTTFITVLNDTFGLGIDMNEVYIAFDEFRQFVSGIIDTAIRIWQSFTENIDPTPFQNAFSNIQSIFGQVAQFFSDNAEAIGEVLGGIVTVVGMIAEGITGLIDILGPFAPAIAAVVLEFKGFMAISEIVSTITTLGEVLGTATGALGGIGTAISAVGGLLTGPVGIVVAIVAAVTALVTFIATNEDAQKAIQDAWNDVVKFFEGIGEWWGGVLDGWKDFQDNMAQTMDNIADGIKSGWEDLKKSTKEAWDESVRKVSDAWNNIKGTVSEKAAQVADNMSRTWSDVKTTVGNTWENIKQSISTAGSNIFNNVRTFMSNVSTNIGNVWDGIVNFFSGIPGRIVEAIGNMGNLLVNAGRELMWGFRNGITKVFQDVWEMIQNIPQNIINWFSSAGQWLWNAGQNLIQGLIDGISDKALALWNFLGDMANNAIDTVKGWFGIASPSKVFRQIGVYLDEGLEQGIEKGSKSIYDTLGGVMDNVLDIADKPINLSSTYEMNKPIQQQETAQTQTKEPPSIYIDKMYVRNDGDIDMFANKLNDLWLRDAEGALV